MNAARVRWLSLSTCAALLTAGWLGGASMAGAFGALGLFVLMPGMLILNRAQRPLRLAHLLAATLISMPVSTLLFALTRLAGLGVRGTIGAMSAAVLGIALGSSWKNTARWRISRSDVLALSLAGGAAVMLGLALLPPGILASWHGFFHAAVVEQILHEGVPPTNPGLVGETLNFYWAFHVFVALITATSNANPLTAIAAINAMMLALFMLIAYETARYFLPRSRDRLLSMAALLGAINTGAGLILVGKLARHGHIPGDAFSDGAWIDWLSQRAIPGRLWDGRASAFIKEYYDISGMAAGMTLFFAYAWLWIGGSRHWRAWFIPLLLATLVTLITWYPPLALPALAHCGMAVIYYGWRKRVTWRQGFPGMSWAALTLLCGLLIVPPYFLTITNSAGWIGAGEPFISLHADARSIIAAVTPFWLLAPFIVLALAVGLRRHRPAYMHLVLLSLILCVFAAGTDVQQNTQYKFIYVLSLPLGLLALQGIRIFCDRFALTQRHPRLTTTFLALLFVHPALIFALGAATSQQQRDDTLSIAGRNIVDRTDPARMACLAWIRDHTPQGAVLILPLLPHDRSPSNPGFRAPAIAQRGALAVYDVYHGLRFRDYEPRNEIIQDIFDRNDWQEAARALAVHGPRGPVYVLAPKNEESVERQGWTVIFTYESWMVLRCEM